MCRSGKIKLKVKSSGKRKSDTACVSKYMSVCIKKIIFEKNILIIAVPYCPAA